MKWWIEFKKNYERGSVLDLVVDRKVPPGFLFFTITDHIQGSLHVSELNWNFGLCQTDFRSIKVGSTLRVYVIGYDDKYKKVHLSRKMLPSIEKPSKSLPWQNLILQKEISATVFEEFRNKVVIQLESHLFGTIPLVGNKSYRSGEKIQVIPIRKVEDQNIIECTLREVATISEQQRSDVIDTFKKQVSNNEFYSSEFYLNSYQQLVDSLYWNYFAEEERTLLKKLFDKTPNLFSKVEKGEEPIYIEFDFDTNAYNDFVGNVAPAIFDVQKLPTNFSEKDLLIHLSKLSFWYTQFEVNRIVEGTEQNVIEKLFSLFNDTVSIRGFVSEEGSLKIRNIKAKVRFESLKEKQTALKRNDVIYINRPVIFSQFAPINGVNKTFIETIDNKLIAFKIFEVAKTKSLDILQKQGRDFKIFSNFLESQIDFEVKSANSTEVEIKECKLELDVQTDGITFTGNITGDFEIQIEEKVAISNRIEKRPRSIGAGTVLSIKNEFIKIKSNVENFELLKNGCYIKRIRSIKQYVVQLEVLNKFFANQLPLDSFYQVFHDKENIEPPETASIRFDNPIFEGKDNPQTLAIRKAVGNKNILLIQGPPGTGKTTVITEIVRQLIKKGEKILVTSQTHIAVDNVLERIKDDRSISIARVGHEDTASDFAAEFLVDEARKAFAEKVQKIVDIKIELLNHHNQGRDISQFSKQNFEVPLNFDWQNIQNFISLVQSLSLEQTTLMVETLEQWKQVVVKTPQLLTDIFLLNLNVLFGTCIGIATNKELSYSEIFFDTVILDEAGKANISETLTAISRAKKIILVGDHKQLPPYLDIERVDYFKKFSRDFTEQRIKDSDIKQALGASFFEYLQREGVLRNENKIMLSVQHRMHPDIGNFISQAFYDSELINGEHTKENILPLPPPFDRQIIFIDTSSDSGSAESFKDGSYYNEVEAQLIVNTIIPEFVRNNVNSKSYAIVTPYSKQCQRIRELLLDKDLHAFNAVEVATLDSFQGREHDIIIFSFTRSSSTNKVGFLDDARRLNVAFSRARKKLILIGNIQTLTNKYSHYDQYYTNLFFNLSRYASKYGKKYLINELDFRRVQSSFKIGELKKGKIRRIQERIGVFVNLGTKDGLIPISFFSTDPNNLLHVNQEIEVKIKSIDQTGKITLQLNQNHTNHKQLGKKKCDSYNLFKSKHKVGNIVVGKILKINSVSFGKKQAFLELEFSATGILYYDQASHNNLRPGQEIKFKIKSFNEHKYSIRGSIIK